MASTAIELGVPLSMTDIAALLGIVFGSIGMVLGLVNYFRDKPKVRVELRWNWRPMKGSQYDPKRLYGMITAVNVGRRPIFISHASIRLPKGYRENYLLLEEGISGVKLVEGDPPKRLCTETLSRLGLFVQMLILHKNQKDGKIGPQKVYNQLCP